MPIYEYQCQTCDTSLEKLQKISDAPLTRCPSCEQETLQKKISAAGFRLKGTGWYETDFKNNNKNKQTPKGSKTTTD
jgi:putative FmdB family regulatory protein